MNTTEEYTDRILKEAKTRYKPGDEVISPMTGKRFAVQRVEGSWHKTWITGFDGTFFFDSVWFDGKWAEKLTDSENLSTQET